MFNLDLVNFVYVLENLMLFDIKKVCIISFGIDILKVVVLEFVKDMVFVCVDRMMFLE